MDNSYFSEQCY